MLIMLITETSRVTTLGLALLFAIGMVSSGFASQGGFTTIDVPGASSTAAVGINPQGDIWGYSYNGGNFLLSKGVFTAIDAPGSVNAINPNGDIVGTYFASATTHGYLLSKGNFTTIDVPGASATFANGINPQGNIVGAYRNATGMHGFLLSGGVFTTIDVPIDVPGFFLFSTVVNGINLQGDIVGSYEDFVHNGDAHSHGFLLSKGVFTTFGFPGFGETISLGINPAGDIVGAYFSAGTPPKHGFLLGGGVFTTIDFPGAIQTIPSGITPKGDIVGTYRIITAFNDVTHGFLLSK